MGLIIDNNELAPEKKQVIELLSSGKTVVEAAAAAEINRNTIYKWLSDKDFNAALNEAIDKKTSLLFVQGLQQLEDILLYSPSNKERLAAFEIISRLSDRYKEKTEVTIKTEQQQRPQDLDKLLQDLDKTFV